MKEHEEEIHYDPAYTKRWKEKVNDTVKQIETLSSVDKKWFEDEWSKWLYTTYGDDIKKALLKN